MEEYPHGIFVWWDPTVRKEIKRGWYYATIEKYGKKVVPMYTKYWVPGGLGWRLSDTNVEDEDAFHGGGDLSHSLDVNNPKLYDFALISDVAGQVQIRTLPMGNRDNLEAFLKPYYRVFVTGLEIEDEEDQEWGSFSVYKEFDIRLNTAQNAKVVKVTGFILQRVERKTTVNVHYIEGHPRVLNTTQEIYDFTNKFVEFANDVYYELFVVEDGYAEFGDRFKNGQLLRYDDEGYGLVEPDGNDLNEPPTSGKVVMTGKNVFIPASEQEVKALENHPKNKPIKLLDIQWKTDKEGPSAELPYVFEHNASATTMKKIKNLFKGRKVTTHKATVTWTRQRGETKVQNKVSMK